MTDMVSIKFKDRVADTDELNIYSFIRYINFNRSIINVDKIFQIMTVTRDRLISSSLCVILEVSQECYQVNYFLEQQRI